MGFKEDVLKDPDALEYVKDNPKIFQSRRFLQNHENGNSLKNFLSNWSKFKKNIRTRNVTNGFEIVKALFDICHQKNLVDPRNVDVVICDEELKKTFGVAAFHIDYFQVYVEKHLVQDSKEPFVSEEDIDAARHMVGVTAMENPYLHRSGQQQILRSYHDSYHNLTKHNKTMPPPRIIFNAYVTSTEQTFEVSLGLQRLLDPTAKLPNDAVYSEHDIYTRLLQYIDARASHFLIAPRIHLIRDDPLSEIFECRAYHFDQLPALLHRHLAIPKNPNRADPFSCIHAFYSNRNMAERLFLSNPSYRLPTPSHSFCLFAAETLPPPSTPTPPLIYRDLRTPTPLSLLVYKQEESEAPLDLERDFWPPPPPTSTPPPPPPPPPREPLDLTTVRPSTSFSSSFLGIHRGNLFFF